MDLRVKKFNVWSLSRMLGVLQGGVGFITGVFFTISYMIDPEFLRATVGSIGTFFGFWSFIVLPVLNAALGFLTGVLIASVYNFYVNCGGPGILFTVQTEG